MTLTEIQSKLATHSPRLLSCKESGMSGGPWRVIPHKLYTHVNLIVGPGQEDVVTAQCRDADARFIAATNGERPWAKILWGEYLNRSNLAAIHKQIRGIEELEPNPTHKTAAINILLALDAAHRLGWVSKKEGE